jgi:drug/metabolite transporter (DMT)-like permease
VLTGESGSSAYGRLLLAIVAVSCAAPLIRLCDSGPVQVAFWRVFFAAAAVWTILLLRRRSTHHSTHSGWAIVAGVLLGFHFWAWISSLYYTSVANSVLLVTTQPIWAAMFGIVVLRERVPVLGWCGILLALAGCAATVGYEGVQLRGDLLAIAGAILAACYMVVGRHQRRTWETLPYIARVYGAAAITLGVILFSNHEPWLPERTSDWWVFAALAAIPTGIGHTLYNAVLKHLPAYVVATSITGEPIGASLLAFWWIGEAPPLRTLLIAPVILAGIFLVGLSQRRKDVIVP